MRYLILLAILIVIYIIVSLTTITLLQRQLEDCHFECNSLQTKIDRLQELNDMIEAINQTLPPLALAQLKVVDKMIKDKRHSEYERYEQPLIERR